MRLVDADKLLKFFTVDTANQTYRFGTVKKQIESAPTVNAIPIPEGATNGEMMKIMFPDLKVEIESTHITCWIDEHRWFAPDYDWWNAPYKRESEE